MANKVVCMRWGEVYTQNHVDKLYDRVKANCSVDFDFYCYEYVDVLAATHKYPDWGYYQKKHFRGLDDPDQRAQGAWNDYERDDCGGLTHYRKLLMFGLDTDQTANKQKLFAPDDTILYLDLDVMVLKDIAPFFELDNDKPWIVKSYWFDRPGLGEWERQYHLRRCPYFNSSVLVWKPGQNRPIFDFINNNLNEVFYQYGVNDNLMFHTFGPWTYSEERRNHFNVYPKGMVTSEKYCDPTDRGIIHSLEGLSIKEKDALCFL